MNSTDMPFQRVVVHPVVLLSVVDHYSRMGKVGGSGRVVGALLGSQRLAGYLDVTNCYAVPFDEDPRDPDAWFFDHDYLESMYALYRKVNSREKIIGWYHTGPKLCRNDILINDVMRRYYPHAVLVIVDTQSNDFGGLPTDAYYAVEEVHDDGSPTTKTFEHLPSEMGAEEAEEVGVEHLLRDIRDSSIGSLTQRISRQLLGMQGLEKQLRDIAQYVDDVLRGRLPVNHQITYLLQDIFNRLPDVHVDSFVQSVYVSTNDQSLVLYLASLIRTVIALHNLIQNKIANRDAERPSIEPPADKKDDKKTAADAAAKKPTADADKSPKK